MLILSYGMHLFTCSWNFNFRSLISEYFKSYKFSWTHGCCGLQEGCYPAYSALSLSVLGGATLAKFTCHAGMCLCLNSLFAIATELGHLAYSKLGSWESE
jgi:hypothetical protein